jgi:trk system potassium uptake protein
MESFAGKIASSDYVVIVGCGRLGANLANTLSENGGNVLVIDKDKEAFRKLSPSFGGLTIVGDATDFDVLGEDAQMGKANVVVAVTNNDNINIIVAQIAHEVFKIRQVIARLYDPDRECVYREFGIDTICPAILSAKEIEKILSKNDGKDFYEEAEK